MLHGLKFVYLRLRRSSQLFHSGTKSESLVPLFGH